MIDDIEKTRWASADKLRNNMDAAKNMSSVRFPEYLFQVIDAAVAHALDGAAVPTHMEELESWLELNEPEILCETYEAAIHESYLQENFVDEEVRDWMCLDEGDTVTDSNRLDFAQSFLSRVLMDGPYEGIHCYRIVDSGGRAAVLGLATYGPGGQHGFEYDWWGVFPDWEAVCRLANERGYWVGGDLYGAEDQELLDFWKG